MVDQVFLRLDLGNEHKSGKIAFYRLPTHMKVFLNQCKEKYGDIKAVILDMDEDGNYGFNIGFDLGE